MLEILSFYVGVKVILATTHSNYDENMDTVLFMFCFCNSWWLLSRSYYDFRCCTLLYVDCLLFKFVHYCLHTSCLTPANGRRICHFLILRRNSHYYQLVLVLNLCRACKSVISSPLVWVSQAHFLNSNILHGTKFRGIYLLVIQFATGEHVHKIIMRMNDVSTWGLFLRGNTEMYYQLLLFLNGYSPYKNGF